MTRGSNYTKHWFDERAVAIGMLACVPIGIVYPCAAVNYALGIMIPLHNYWYACICLLLIKIYFYVLWQ